MNLWWFGSEKNGCRFNVFPSFVGTLTANKMTARALLAAMKNYLVTDPSMSLGEYVKTFEGGASSQLVELIANLISICTMDETVLYYDDNGKVEGCIGKPNRGCASATRK